MLKKYKTLIAVLLIIIFELFIYAVESAISNYIKIITLATIFLLSSGYFIYLKVKKEKYNIKHIIYLVIIIGILLRTMYIVYTPITDRQHDVYSIEDEGHLGYIYTIYETGDLPKTNNIQFYHPPLFHAISAGWLKLNDIFNVQLEKSLEGIQVITAIFSSLILIVTYKIINELKIKDEYKLLINAFMATYPTFIILAGSINNDILTILLQFCIILYLIKWDKKESLKNTIILALITGSCVMSKISGAIMAIPIMIVFIKKIIEIFKKDKKKLLGLFLKFLVFGLISLTLGLWHPIRNYIMFNQSLGWVLLPNDELYIGNYTYVQRFFSISFSELFKELYCVVPNDYNIFAYIIKCSIFGEFSYKIITTPIILKLLNITLIITSLAYIMKYILKDNKDSENKTILNLFILIWLINIISFYTFNINYPYTCTMDFRYIPLTAFIGIVMIINGLKSTTNQRIVDIVEIIISMFITFSTIMFFLI